jgi:pyrimidine deaminase RibD-like protein
MHLLDLISESRSDYEIHNRPKLDRILTDLCQLVIAGQRSDPHRWGMVAACVLDHKNQRGVGLNYYDKRVDLRVHAERAALDAYYAKYGVKPPRGSIIITTCSPCSSDHMQGRYGQDCTDLVNEAGVHKVYAGFEDPSQPERQRDFNIEITDNAKINKLCERFARTFLETQP